MSTTDDVSAGWPNVLESHRNHPVGGQASHFARYRPGPGTWQSPTSPPTILCGDADEPASAGLRCHNPQLVIPTGRRRPSPWDWGASETAQDELVSSSCLSVGRSPLSARLPMGTMIGAHADHVRGIEELPRRTGARVAVHELDAPVLVFWR